MNDKFNQPRSCRSSKSRKVAGLSVVLLVLCPFIFSTHCLAQERTLSFPPDQTNGTIWVYGQPTPSGYLPGYTNFSWERRLIGSATGKLRIPDNAFVGLEVSATKGYEEFLARLPEDGIDRLDLNGATISTEMLKHIERVKSLRVLMLRGCRFDTDLEATKLQGMPRLMQLYWSPRENSTDGHKAIVTWAAKCRSLQYLRDSSSELNAVELRLFNRHPSPLFLTVKLGKNADEIFDALKDIPNLVALNVYVEKDVSDNYHRHLDKLKHVVLFNWSGGNLNAEFLQSLRKLNQLRTIRFQGDAQVTDEFVVGLPVLKSVESLSFNFSLSAEQQKLLPESLLRMSRLRELPEIEHPSSDMLSEISKRTNWRRIAISGLGADSTIEQLINIIRANRQLEYLRLSDIDFTAGLAHALCQCSKLKDLRLSVTDFNGDLLVSPEGLENLERLSLGISGAANGLSVLSRIPNLSSIQVSLTTLNPEGWFFIADAPSLTEFKIVEGFCDDRIAKWIRQSKSLRSFSCGQNGIMTDAVFDELCKCEQLEALKISGFISREGIEQLTQLPRLSSLAVSSNLLDEIDKENLVERFKHLRYFDLDELSPSSGLIERGKDGLYRRTLPGGRSGFDAMEGKTLKELLGGAMDEVLEKKLQDKVVLVEFWGTWCGPCLDFVPELMRLHNQYIEESFHVLTVHSMKGCEKANDYLNANPKPWSNIIDEDGAIENRFGVPSFPSLYLIGRDGKMRVSLAHRLGLDRSIKSLLEDK